jgi:hypothetical protein
MKKILFFFLGIIPAYLFAQITGKITDKKGDIVPFVNVYVENTTRGTTANTEGVYQLDLEDGKHRLVFQSLGFQKKTVDITLKGKLKLDIVLESADIELSEVVVKSNAEDPAYPIIRNAIAQRNYFLNQVPNYHCDVYIKGLHKVMDTPKKIMGREVGNMGGSLDTANGKRQGIVYFSETLSKLYVENNKRREELLQSKVSGNSNGLSFNRATLFNFDMNQNYNDDLPRKFMSPIADNALQYYRYKLIGSTRNEETGLTIYKIEILPKREEDPTWGGIIYIVDNQWNIYGTDLWATGKKMQIDFVDTLRLHQDFVQVQPKIWRIFSQTVQFKFGFLGIKFGGYFAGTYSNFKIDSKEIIPLKRNETFTAINAKKENDTEKWNQIRPTPLTNEEAADYVRKDSIQKIRQSKPYIDSVMHEQNKFRPLSILGGYTYSNYYGRWSIGSGGILETISFNPIQGFNGNLKLNFNKRFADSLRAPTKQYLNITPQFNYGLSEKKIRPEIVGSFQFNRFNDAKLTIAGGQRVQTFNTQSPITLFWAATDALFQKQHVYYIYDKKYFRVNYGQEYFNGFYLDLNAEYAQRRPLSNMTNFSFSKKDLTYNPNAPEVVEPTRFGAEGDNAFLLGFNIRYVFGQKYATYPHEKERETPKYPILTVNYVTALSTTDASPPQANFSKYKLRLVQNSLPMGLFGYSEIAAEYGGFLNRTRVSLVDFNHFNGNEIRVINPLNYMEGWYQLPFYKYSTTNNYFMAHYQHHFEGWILGKIPLIRKLGFKEVIRVAYLNTKQLNHYAEMGFGIDNIGYGLFRMLRIDFSWQYMDGKLSRKPFIMYGINAPLGN